MMQSRVLIFTVLFASLCFAQEKEDVRRPSYIINDIIIVGNKHTSPAAMRNYIPYRIGEEYNPQKTGALIRNLYYNLKWFRNIAIKGDLVDGNKLNLYVIVEEKAPLKEVTFKGAKQITEKEI